MSYSFGNSFRVTLFGQSHSEALGVVIEGLPAGFTPDLDAAQRFLNRRAPGNAPWSTARQEDDRFEIVSGLADGKTCGAPLCAVLFNKNTRSSDYDALFMKPRPSHADFPAYMKFGESHDIRGGGSFSGRLTAPLCFAGALAMQLLEKQGIAIGAHLAAAAGIEDLPFDPVEINKETMEQVKTKAFPVQNDDAGKRMIEAILAAKADGDSVGGIIECAVTGLPAGCGEPPFDGIENRIAQILFAIPAVKGVEFGSGFASAAMRGSEHNDPFCVKDGCVKTETNRHGGVLGGLTTGMPLVFRAAIKPTPSIAKEQKTVDLKTMEETTIQIQGRHDPCIAPRAVPCVEAAAAIALINSLL